MKIEKIYSASNGFCDVFQDEGGQTYLVALCAGIAWSRVGVVMTDDEVAAFLDRPEFADALGLKLCKDFAPYRDRAIPVDVRDAIVAADT